MDTQKATEEIDMIDMTEIEERIEDQKQHTLLLLKQLECECPDSSCQVAHES